MQSITFLGSTLGPVCGREVGTKMWEVTWDVLILFWLSSMSNRRYLMPPGWTVLHCECQQFDFWWGRGIASRNTKVCKTHTKITWLPTFLYPAGLYVSPSLQFASIASTTHISVQKKAQIDRDRQAAQLYAFRVFFMILLSLQSSGLPLYKLCHALSQDWDC